MATSKIALTEGTGKNAATYSVSEDAVTKEVQRVSINTNTGNEAGTVGNPWNSLGTTTLAGSLPNGVNNIGFATVTPSTLSRTILGNVTVSMPSGVTVYQGNQPWNSLGTVTLAGSLPEGINNIGFATVTPTTLERTISANVTVQQGSTPWMSLGTTTIASAPTIYAVVNTSSSNSNVTLNPSQNWIGLATTTIGSAPTIYAVVNTAAAGVGNSLVTILPRTDYIGLVSVSGNVVLQPTSSGGCSIFRSIDLDETEEDVHGVSGQIYGWFLSNANASVNHYIKFYNTTAANTSVGVNTPIMTLPLLGGQAANVEFSTGIPFATALCVAATTGIADDDIGAPAANNVIMNLFYK